MRHELKYIMSLPQYTILKSCLRHVLRPDIHGGKNGEYFVRSIYFDSPEKNALNDKKDGISHRQKYRIRLYNGNAEHCRLEKKTKEGTRVCKHFASLTGQEAEALLQGKTDLGEEQTVLRELQFVMNCYGYKPVVTVDYLREAYVLPLSDLRITFDREIAWGGTEDCLKRERYISNVCIGKTVLEVKYNDFLPQYIRDILSSVSIIQTSLSKYALCTNEKMAVQGF